MTAARVWIGPDRAGQVVEAVGRAGAREVPVEEANVMICLRSDHGDERELAEMRERLHPGIVWVQLDSAGVEAYARDGLFDDGRTWTAAQGAYASICAEHAAALVLAAAKRLHVFARDERWERRETTELRGRTVGIVGAGGIGSETMARLAPFGVDLIALTRSGREVAGAHRSLAAGDLHELLELSDFVVVAAALTPDTRHLIGRRELDLLGPRGWLINVSRGELIDFEALVDALREGAIAGACLDVTDPEPLPEDHPLWGFENVLVTPHVANTEDAFYRGLTERIEENLRRFQAGRDLLGVVDPSLGY